MNDSFFGHHNFNFGVNLFGDKKRRMKFAPRFVTDIVSPGIAQLMRVLSAPFDHMFRLSCQVSAR